jgi:hypothetical protein
VRKKERVGEREREREGGEGEREREREREGGVALRGVKVLASVASLSFSGPFET